MGVEPLSTSRRSARANKSALMESGLKAATVRPLGGIKMQSGTIIVT